MARSNLDKEGNCRVCHQYVRWCNCPESLDEARIAKIKEELEPLQKERRELQNAMIKNSQASDKLYNQLIKINERMAKQRPARGGE